MKDIKILKRTFVRQTRPDDCGLACILMIFKYCGKIDQIPTINLKVDIPSGGLSLLQLKSIAINGGLNGLCVEMEIDFLRTTNTPCILHVINLSGANHYQVCYGAIRRGHKTYYLMADPAKYLYYISEFELQKIWNSKAAIVFPGITENLQAYQRPALVSLLNKKIIPNGLWFAVPLIALFLFLLGIAFTWVLQKSLTDRIIFENLRITIEVVVLLLVLLLSKAIIAYVRQFLLDRINIQIHKELTLSYIASLLKPENPQIGMHKEAFRNNIADIYKIQYALSSLIATLLSDGTLILLMVAMSFYFSPFLGLNAMIYLLISIRFTMKKIPEFISGNINVKEVIGLLENSIVEHLKNKDFANWPEGSDPFVKQKANLQFQVDNFFIQSKAINKTILRYECWGAILIIANFSVSLKLLDLGQFDYTSLMLSAVTSYLIVSLYPKISHSLLIISEGIDAVIQQDSRLRVDS